MQQLLVVSLLSAVSCRDCQCAIPCGERFATACGSERTGAATAHPAGRGFAARFQREHRRTGAQIYPSGELAHVTGMSDSKLPKRTLCVRIKGNDIKGGTDMPERPTVSWPFILTGTRRHRTGQVGGLPLKVCRNAPDLRVRKNVVNV